MNPAEQRRLCLFYLALVGVETVFVILDVVRDDLLLAICDLFLGGVAWCMALKISREYHHRSGART